LFIIHDLQKNVKAFPKKFFCSVDRIFLHLLNINDILLAPSILEGKIKNTEVL